MKLHRTVVGGVHNTVIEYFVNDGQRIRIAVSEQFAIDIFNLLATQRKQQNPEGGRS